MVEQYSQGNGQSRVEIGLDGKPFEVWEPTPQPGPGMPAAGVGQWHPAQPPRVEPIVGGGSYYPRGAAETEFLTTPRRTMEHNDFAWFAIGLSLFASVGAAVMWFVGGGTNLAIASMVMGAAGAYYGMRAHNAGLRGFCTNPGLGRVGMVLGALTALSMLVKLTIG